MHCGARLLERMGAHIAAHGISEPHTMLRGMGVLGGAPAVGCL